MYNVIYNNIAYVYEAPCTYKVVFTFFLNIKAINDKNTFSLQYPKIPGYKIFYIVI